MSSYLSSPSNETRDESFKRMRSGNICDEDFTSEKPRHRRPMIARLDEKNN
jgi:hypothetical protein